MGSLLNLNYYDEEDEQQQLVNDGYDYEETGKITDSKNVSKSISQAIVHNSAESPIKSQSQNKSSQKPLTPSPSVFSNLVRRKSNNSTPHKQRDGESSLSKFEVKSFSPSSQQDMTDRLGKNIDDNSLIPMDIEIVEDAQQQAAMRQLLTPKPIEGKDNWGILTEPETECDQALKEKIAHFHKLKSKGILFNENLQKNKAFRNPHIYNKLVEFVELDEIGSNFDREIFDPYGYPPEAFVDQLAEKQKRQAEERAAAQQQQQRSQIQFVGTNSSSQSISKARHVMQSLAARAEKGSLTAAVAANSARKKRASKWDVPAPNVE
ncbi:6528_t:CDS:2 [Diversispora eburnea]|uniref:6528_t:CDS:1 n=1 Tax=Diversispora eburnea TaxID=1213867 RepID=A0A9N9FCM9_9GLOM|nr:6528_t:CDS:2 [Diversispora eburnea]